MDKRVAGGTILLSAFALLTSLPGADDLALPAPTTGSVDFLKQIEPIFRKNCYSCHGEDVQEGGLRLDQRRRALTGGDAGRDIIPRDSASSRLIRMVAGLDDEYGIMPPEDLGTPLTAEEIGLLRTWIDRGAQWPESADMPDTVTGHWAYQPIQRPDAPPVDDAAWVRNPIDAFVLARLERDGLKPSPPADPCMLAKRLYIDLTGLPPTPSQLDEYLNDEHADAYARMVDRVLSSPHYGERWARHWLDLARYADTDGYEKDRPRPFAWRYRDWVIDALNDDMPFDAFSIRQIAGDLLPDADDADRIATGFHRNTLHNTEGGIDPEEDRVKKTVDRTNTIGTIWLGTTVGCAQCHSHKYDPITQREYYSLYAFFNSMDEQDISAPLGNEQAEYDKKKAAFDAEQAKLRAAVASYEQNDLMASAQEWEATARDASTVWRTLSPDVLRSANDAELDVLPDQSVLATGKNEVSDVYTIETDADGRRLTAVRLEALPHESLVKGGPGRADNGNFVLTTFTVWRVDAEGQATSIPLASAQADFSQSGWSVGLAITGDAQDGWAVSPEIGKRHVAAFQFEQPVAFQSGEKIRVVLDQAYQGQTHNLGHFRLSTTEASGPLQLDGLPADIAAAIEVAAQERTEAQRNSIRDYYRTIDPEWNRLRQAAEKHAKEQAPKAPSSKARAVVERSTPRETRIQLRGDFLNPGDAVAVCVPEAFPQVTPRGDRPDRLDFARWLFTDENPLTARVTVNRVWQRYFGRGIVGTSDDFGTQGDPPSHPELLDWLAAEFRDSGWSLKHLHRLIVTSATYQQSSAARPDLEDVDPLNLLLARQTRRRFEAEIIRDVALAASGLLEGKIGGPSVRPPQPSEYSALTYANSAKWTTSPGGDAYRRGMYTFFQRTSPYPMLMTFDSPDSTLCTAQRSDSNTPLQALTLWNDVVFYECAQSLGRRIVRETAASDRPAHAVRLCLARDATEDEVQTIRELYKNQLDLLQNQPDAVEAIVGDLPRPDSVPLDELAAWVMVGRTLMNLDEFMTKE